MRRLVVGFVLAGLMVLPSLVIVEPAGAIVPGENGLLVYVQDVPSQVSGVTAGEIYTMNPDGTAVRRLTSDAGRWDGTGGGSDVVVSTNSVPRWSPDSPIIAYVHMNESSEYSVRLMDAEGTFIRTITEAFTPITSLAWSPDGSQLAIVGTDLGGGGDGVWVMDVLGTNPRLVVTAGSTGSSMWSIRDLDWSPGGQSIAFSARSGSDSRQILLAQVATGSLNGPFSGGAWAFRPRWNPSGSQIIFTAYTGTTIGDIDTVGSLDDTEVWVNDYPKTSAEPLVAGPGGQHTPTISPDGSQVYYISETDHGLWSQSDGRIVNFTGRDLDWQPIQRIAQSVGLVDPGTGKWHITTLHGMVNQFYYGNPGDFPMMGDWDCSGTDTPGLYRQSDGYVYLRNSNTQGNADIRFFFGNPGDTPIAGDFNGDGCDTVSIYRQSEGRVYIINALGSDDGGLGAADYDYFFGNPGDKPFVGDFNGDGVDTVGLHRETTGLVYFRNSNTQGVAEFEFFFGDPGDRLIAGDWSYDGMDTPGLYRPSDRTFYLRYTNTQGTADEQFTWGLSYWLPVAGNFGPP